MMATATEGSKEEINTALGKFPLGAGNRGRMKPGKRASIFTQRANGVTINTTVLRQLSVGMSMEMGTL